MREPRGWGPLDENLMALNDIIVVDLNTDVYRLGTTTKKAHTRTHARLFLSSLLDQFFHPLRLANRS